MKAIIIPEHGGTDVLDYVDIDEPTIQSPAEIKVKLEAAGINPIDTKLRSGAYPLQAFPMIPGCDGAGTVEETGADVSRFKAGDEVCFFHGGLGDVQGNYAEYKVLDQRYATHKPGSISFGEAAALPLVAITAWEALFDRADLRQDQTIFINAGAGGVGHVAIQLAKHAGARVCTTISSDEKADFVKRLGADLVINYKEENVIESLMQWTDNKGVDIALDNIGGKQTETLPPLVKYYGQIVTLLIPDSELDWRLARFKNQSLTMEVMLSPQLFKLTDHEQHQTDILEKCTQLIDAGKLQLKISKTLPLEQAAQAHEIIEEGHTSGKMVLSTTHQASGDDPSSPCP